MSAGASFVTGTPRTERLVFRQTKRLCPVRGAPSPMRAASLCAEARMSHVLRCSSVRVRYTLDMYAKLALRRDCFGVLTWECCALPLRTVRPPVCRAVTSDAVPRNPENAMEGSAFMVSLSFQVNGRVLSFRTHAQRYI